MLAVKACDWDLVSALTCGDRRIVAGAGTVGVDLEDFRAQEISPADKTAKIATREQIEGFVRKKCG
jgi:hypothetical protein